MQNLICLLRSHAARYPKMEPVDAVKLLYQNEFGGGHMIRDPESCLAYLRREYAMTPKETDRELLEQMPISTEIFALEASEGGVYLLSASHLDRWREETAAVSASRSPVSLSSRSQGISQ